MYLAYLNILRGRKREKRDEKRKRRKEKKREEKRRKEKKREEDKEKKKRKEEKMSASTSHLPLSFICVQQKDPGVEEVAFNGAALNKTPRTFCK